MPGKRIAKKSTALAAADDREVAQYPARFFSEYWRYRAAMRRAAQSERQQRVVIDDVFLKVFGDHIPSDVPTPTAEVIAQYALMKFLADEYNIGMSAAFMQRYHAALKLVDTLEPFNAVTRVPLTENVAEAAEEEEMAVKKKTKKTKTSAKKAKAKKAPKVVKAKAAKTVGAHAYARELIRSKMSQEDMVKAIQKKYPEKAHVHVLGCIRNARKQVEAGKK